MGCGGRAQGVCGVCAYKAVSVPRWQEGERDMQGKRQQKVVVFVIMVWQRRKSLHVTQARHVRKFIFWHCSCPPGPLPPKIWRRETWYI